jgi:hypothetical protein
MQSSKDDLPNMLLSRRYPAFRDARLAVLELPGGLEGRHDPSR